ncbi:MAG TPA: rhodanese-like domain-containing protein, partial [Steroidobacteraceae bacterium]|nr:rhodanese-like domain-containing protein [Steroidobacteraceae bacterium]
VPWLGPAEFAQRSREGIVIDTREPEAFAGGHLAGAYSIWQGGLAPYAGWIADAQMPIYLLADDPGSLVEARLALARIGFDHVAGALRGGFSAWRNSGSPIARSGTVSAPELVDRLGETVVLDVREASEFAAGHIPGARHVPVGELEAQIDQLGLDRGRPIASVCSVGHRGSLGASVLCRAGFSRVANLLGGMTAWQNCGLPLEE